MDFFFWWSVISTVIGILLLIVSIWQYFKAKAQENKVQAQVKVWMQDANGIGGALNRIVVDNASGRYSSANDVCNAVLAVHSCANALYQSLYEERCVTEEEYRARQKRLADAIDKQQMQQLESKS